MSDAERLNDVLRREHPAAFRALSPLGRSLAFPRGIPFQASEAKQAKIDATVGQLTNGAGRAVPIPSLEAAVSGLDPALTFLYAPIEGPEQVRSLWLARERRLANAAAEVSMPFVCHGLTHTLSVIADLFADPETDVVVPQPGWENYDLVFQYHSGARMLRYDLFEDGVFSTASLERALSQVRGKAIVALNLPSNPTGWMPDPSQASQIVEILAAQRGPLVVLTDDAYQGFVYEPGLHERSLFWDLAEKADPERMLCVKVDGATKELVFFSSRISFLTHTATGAAEEALLSKLKTALRATVGPASGPALAMVLAALQDPALDDSIAARLALMARRYRVVKEGLSKLDPARLRARPFNAAFFALLELSTPLQSDALRQRLLREFSVGTVSFPSINALRLAYCSIDESNLPELLDAVAQAAR